MPVQRRHGWRRWGRRYDDAPASGGTHDSSHHGAHHLRHRRRHGPGEGERREAAGAADRRRGAGAEPAPVRWSGGDQTRHARCSRAAPA
ncbi:hypothetical protein G5V59_12055 [Nocardioides sp. W3-2-3]|nr:hypothetical protein [Nocardioides convexus]